MGWGKWPRVGVILQETGLTGSWLKAGQGISCHGSSEESGQGRVMRYAGWGPGPSRLTASLLRLDHTKVGLEGHVCGPRWDKDPEGLAGVRSGRNSLFGLSEWSLKPSVSEHSLSIGIMQPPVHFELAIPECPLRAELLLCAAHLPRARLPSILFAPPCALGECLAEEAWVDQR